ncbi:MAG: carboxypeptidase-like regulatory domain-containing protein [Chitinophagaceae bacterium]
MKKTHTVLILLLLLSFKSFSQIEGDVRNNDDKRIANAIIIVMDTTRNIIDSAVSAENGYYSFKHLKPGIYLVEAKYPGFENKIYKNVIAREPLDESKASRDMTTATRLQIVLVPVKTAK